ncbi:MAG: hypothetical protein ACRC31_01830 [Cetobacterium sp.]
MPGFTFNPPNVISQKLKEFVGNNNMNSVSVHIPDIASPMNGSVPYQNWDFGYSKENDYGGFLPSITDRTPQNTKNFPYNLTPWTFNLQMTRYQKDIIQSMTEQQIFATSMSMGTKVDPQTIKKAVDNEYFGEMIKQLAIQTVTRNDDMVFKVVADPLNYTPTNTLTLPNAIPSWTDVEGSRFVQALANGAEYCDKISGGRLLIGNANESAMVQNDYQLLIVIPRHIYTLMVGVWQKAFAGYNTLMGYDGKGNVGGAFRGLTPALFAHAIGFSGAKVIVPSTRYNDSILNELDTSSTNFKHIWSENSVYMFTTSTNLIRPASIMKPVYRPDTMFSTMFLDTEYVKTTGTYGYIAPISNFFYKINLTIA